MTDTPTTLPYKRVLLKLSGEVLQNRETGLSIDPVAARSVAERVKAVVEMDIEVALVVGGGNIFRGLSGATKGIDRSTGDYMGMLATVINALALQDALEDAGLETRVQTAISMRQIAEPFIRRRALRHLEKGRVLIFGAGTGNPYFSTDSAAALRASEIGADALLKATKVDGVYDADPELHADARRFTQLTYTEAISRSLKVMDAAAFALCRDNHIPIIVFNFFDPEQLLDVLRGKAVGTRVGE